jgi:hypothetical protein
MNATVRNALIVVALAAAVYLLPGGGNGASFVSQVLGTLITASFAFLGWRMYRERRMDLESLGDPHRGMLYGALAAIVWAMAARGWLFDTTAGILVWCALIGGAAYALVLVFRRHRDLSY